MYFVIKLNPDFYGEDYHDQILGLEGRQELEAYPLFNSGKLINSNEPLLYSTGSNTKLSNKYLKLDLLPANPFLVSPKFANIFREYCKNSVELIASTIKNSSDYYEGYFSVNFLKTIDCIDFLKSDTYRMLPSDPNSPIVFNHLVFKDGGLDGNDVATAKDGPEFNLASQGFADLCKDHGITGIDFWPDGSPPWTK